MNTLGIRLQQARKAAGLNLRDFSNLIGISHTAISKYENGKLYPSSDMLIKLAKILNVRIDSLFRPIKVSLENIKFRKRQKLTAKNENAIKFNVINQIERRLELENLYPSSPIPLLDFPINLPDQINHLDEIEDLAEQLRNHWKLGLDAIHNLTYTFESIGVRVFVAETDSKDFDGLSVVINDLPIIVTTSNCSGDRQRFNLAHELAHYIFINRLSYELDEEKACHRFAAAFLIPRANIFNTIERARKSIDWNELFALKKQFKISIAALCIRLRDLNIITEKYLSSLFFRIKKNKWNQKEPVDIPFEQSIRFDQLLFHALGKGYIGESKAAELLGCSITKLKAIRQVKNGTDTCHQ